MKSEIIVEIYDMLGNKLAILIDEDMLAGQHEVIWDASGLSNGIYICAIYVKAINKNSIATRTIKLVKVE